MIINEGKNQLNRFKNGEKIQFLEKMTQNDFEVWSNIFEKEIKGWKIVKNEQIDRLIEEVKKDSTPENCAFDGYIRTLARLANSFVMHYNPKLSNPPWFVEACEELYPIFVQKWRKAFEFSSLFQEEFTKCLVLG